MQKVKVDFVGIIPTLFAHCQHCMQVMHETGLKPYSEQFEEYPDDIKEQYFGIAELAQKITKEFRGQVVFDAVDPASILGLWYTVRYRITKTPCILINGKKVFDKIPSYEELRKKIIELLDVHTQTQSTLPR